jgi:hypothetical protein
MSGLIRPNLNNFYFSGNLKVLPEKYFLMKKYHFPVWSSFVPLAFGWGFVGVMVTVGLSFLGCTVAVILKIRSMNTCPLTVGQNIGLLHVEENVPVQGD